MYTYKRVIKTPHSIEVEYYRSLKKIGKYYGGRGVNRGLSSEKQKKANQQRNKMKFDRLIDCNFCENDYFCRFSAPFGTFCDEEDFIRHVNNWFRRIKRRCAKQGLTFKYIGFRECGKLGKNWHLHIILSEAVTKIARECWEFKNGGINLTPLYANHEYEALARYIQKDVSGSKRMMTSRNLEKPEINVRQATRREIRSLERGEYIEPPQGWYLSKDELIHQISDITGASWYLRYRPIKYRANQNRRV